MNWNSSQVRQLLTEGFSVSELSGMCFDNKPFRGVYETLGLEGRRGEYVDHLLDLCDRHQELRPVLLQWAEEENPLKYRSIMG